LIFSLMLSQTLFMSSSSLTFSKAANLFVISIWYCFLTSRSNQNYFQHKSEQYTNRTSNRCPYLPNLLQTIFINHIIDHFTYADDILIIHENTKMDTKNMLKDFNYISLKSKFTMAEEKDNKLFRYHIKRQQMT
jgi:hypothetical protein